MEVEGMVAAARVVAATAAAAGGGVEHAGETPYNGYK